MRDAGTLHHGAEGAIMHAQQVGHAVILQPLAIVHDQYLHHSRSMLLDIRRCSGRCGEWWNVTGAKKDEEPIRGGAANRAPSILLCKEGFPAHLLTGEPILMIVC